MRILFLGYRDWALNCFAQLKAEWREHNWELIDAPEKLTPAVRQPVDLIFVVGWSWLIPAEIVKDIVTLGMHPSDLPNYGGGSPIQHQILDGITKTRISLFKLSEHFDEGPIVAKQAFDFSGSLDNIFARLSVATVDLINAVLRVWPNVTYVPQYQPGEAKIPAKRRLKPEDSELTPERLTSMTAKQLYDFMRCRTDPYPNVYIEDETGRLLIKAVDFESKE